MGERMIFDTDSDPGMQVVALDDGRLSFSCVDDWCGDTESGFGAVVNVQLTREKVVALHDALALWLDRTPDTGDGHE